MDLSHYNLVQLLPPALLVSAAAYLTHFFGKVIADQQPFVDDRKWHIELAGVYFFVNQVVFPGILGIAAALHWGSLGTGHKWHLFIVSVIGAFLLFTNTILGDRLYQKKSALTKIFVRMAEDEKSWENFTTVFINLSALVFPWILSIILVYVMTLEYQMGNVWWFAAMAVEVFLAYLFLALNYSLRITKLPKVDLYVVSSKKPLRGLMLLKLNADNVRLRDKDKVILLERSQVAKIEIAVDQLENSNRPPL